MNNSKLIQLIRESINDYIREIDHAGEEAAVSAKIAKIGEAIESREKKMNMEGIDEAYHDMIDKGKMKELSGEVKALKKSLAKYEKQLEKLKNKGEKVTKVEDTEEKEIVDEVAIDENEGMEYEGMGMEMGDERFDADGTPNEEGMYDAEGNRISFADIDKAMYDGEAEYMNESFLHMQKLAGILSETEYKAKVEEAKKMTAAQKEKKEDIVKGMKKSKNFGKSKDEKAKMYATATKLATKKKAKGLKEEVLALFENEINFTDKDQYQDFLQNKTKELENSKIKLKIGKKIYTIPSAIAEGKEEHELIYEVYSSDFKVGDKVKFNPEAMKKMGFENPIDYYKDLTGIIAEIYHYDIMSNGIPTDVLYIDLNKPIQPPGGYVGNTEEESERGMNELTLVKSEGDFNMITKI